MVCPCIKNESRLVVCRYDRSLNLDLYNLCAFRNSTKNGNQICIINITLSDSLSYTGTHYNYYFIRKKFIPCPLITY